MRVLGHSGRVLNRRDAETQRGHYWGSQGSTASRCCACGGIVARFWNFARFSRNRFLIAKLGCFARGDCKRARRLSSGWGWRVSKTASVLLKTVLKSCIIARPDRLASRRESSFFRGKKVRVTMFGVGGRKTQDSCDGIDTRSSHEANRWMAELCDLDSNVRFHD